MHVRDGCHGVSLLHNQSQLYTLNYIVTKVYGFCRVLSFCLLLLAVSTFNEYLFTQGKSTLTMFSAGILHI